MRAPPPSAPPRAARARGTRGARARPRSAAPAASRARPSSRALAHAAAPRPSRPPPRAAVVEASEALSSNRLTVLVVQDLPPGVSFDGNVCSASELDDLNRGRAYLRAVAARHGAVVLDDVKAAVREVLRLLGK